jgi:hypothetical protein
MNSKKEGEKETKEDKQQKMHTQPINHTKTYNLHQ